jgi:hypothetical protein
MTGLCANETCAPAEAAGVDVEQKILIAAIDVHSATAKCKTRQVRLIARHWLPAPFCQVWRSSAVSATAWEPTTLIHATLRYCDVEQVA